MHLSAEEEREAERVARRETTMSQILVDDHLRAAAVAKLLQCGGGGGGGQFERENQAAGERAHELHQIHQQQQQQQQSNQPQGQEQQQQLQLPQQQQQQPQPLQRQYPPNHPLGNSKHLCCICGDRATGKHYGVYSCEGCKGFFKRTIRKDIVYVCRAQGACLIDMRQRNRCQYCRYQKCLSCGMKREAVQEEKQRLKMRAAAAAAAAAASQNGPAGHADDGQHNYFTLPASAAYVHTPQPLEQANPLEANHNHNHNQPQNTFGPAGGRQRSESPPDAKQCDRAGQREYSRAESTISSMFNPSHHQHHPYNAFSPTYHANFGATPRTPAEQTVSPSPTAPMIEPHQLPHQPQQQPQRQRQHNFDVQAELARLGRHNQLARPEHIDELTLKWAAQVQVERLLDWAKSVPKFTELLLDDQVTLLKGAWNELLIADMAFKSVEWLAAGAKRPRALAIGGGLHLSEQQAHDIGLGTMFERILGELASKMHDMRLDASELACLRAIILFNPETHALKPSQPIEEHRANIYTSLESHCRRHYGEQPNRFGKLLLRLPVLRSIGLKCHSVRRPPACDTRAGADQLAPGAGYPQQQQQQQQADSLLLAGSLGSPASSASGSVLSTCSPASCATSSSSGAPTGGGQGNKVLGYPVKLLFFDLCYESTTSSVDGFLRSSLATH